MITQNIKILEEKITAKCSSVRTNREDIKLIAVSKYNPVAAIEEACNAGIKHFGENRAQEFCEKAELINNDIVWHFIGHLQSNKVKNVVEFADYIHSVESVKLLEEINKRAENIGKKQKILLEVKTSGEDSKYGLTEQQEIFTLADKCRELNNIDLIGLMTMAPFTDDKKVIRECFSNLRLFKNELNLKGYNLTELSMGMSNDWEIAIEEGSTMLRIGTTIFGERDYSISWKEQ